jgi:N-hydroxyarylamine O-acetyltransferase
MQAEQLDRYLARVGYRGPRTPSLEALHALTAAHSTSIPFENLAVLLGQGIDIAPDAVFAKLVEQRRGGYCFEQNGLFLRVLTALGFQATPMAARVHMGQPRDFVPPRTHLFVRVGFDDGSVWLSDVGIGSMSLTAAIRFELDLEQATPHEPRRIVRDGDRYFHQARLGDEWLDVYQFSGEIMPRIDQELGNWYTSTHPQSHFRRDMMVARAAADGGRLSLLKTELKQRARDGHAEVTNVRSPEHLRELLASHFGIRLPEGTRF